MERKIIGMLGAVMIALATFCPLVRVPSSVKYYLLDAYTYDLESGIK